MSSKRSSWFSFTKPPSSGHPNLAEHRRNSNVPFSRPPFQQSLDDNGELQMNDHPAEVPYSDLLLEIAMTTTFASLTDGTPIFEVSNVASYLSFFALVWWIWASQVAYNVRFRRADWMHRFFVFLQFFIFCGLAAFTHEFNITSGVVDDTQEENEADALEREAFQDDQFTLPFLEGQKYRDNLLPKLNFKGVSIVMALSRLLLLIQYSVAYYHARQVKDIPQAATSRKPHRWHPRFPSFVVHILSLLFSAICFFVAYAVIGHNPDEDDQIAKFVLWYFPLLVEVAAHFVAISGRYKGWVHYDSKLISERSATVFVIILGGGLDNITKGFRLIVGNVSFGWQSLGIIFCGVLIFLLLFALHFNTPEPEQSKRSLRVLGAFFFQFFYLSAVIVNLEAISAMLQAGTIGNGLDIPLQFLRDTQQIMELKGFGRSLNESDYMYSNIAKQLTKEGIELGILLPEINSWIDNATSQNPPDYNLPYNALLWMDEEIIEIVLQNLDSSPADDLLVAKMDAFYSSLPNNYTLVNNQTFNDIVESVITMNATPALWFYGSGGAFLVALGLLSLLDHWPARDKFEWGQILSRLSLGSTIIILSSLDLQSSRNILTDDFHYGDSRIWFLATHSLVLPPYAAALLVEHIIELVLLRKAHSYSETRSSVSETGTDRVMGSPKPVSMAE
ncbi:hypothetical protein K435DRAFT_861588 [Dendrothele bispora CBS 962.96]|uniref:Low temperature requirement protein A n=1 Tax=Dendrothele bispora (strain CBS 962.96) TaxID=1314807 RepID=A0A4S8LUU8_DENBC|nr:hypothetical protein K435DRAFT_861588 [Dendrothele bispora CBS 962.96]